MAKVLHFHPPSLPLLSSLVAKFENSIVWFRNDLRVHDNEALAKAVKESKHVLPVYCFDPRHFGKSRIGKMPRSSIHRSIFHLETITDLKENLQKLGGDLVILKGEPEAEIPKLVEKYKINAVYFQEEATSEETDVEKTLHKSLAAMNVSVFGIWGLTLFHRQDLPYPVDRLPDVFTAFRKQIETKGRVREEFPTPKTISLPPSIKENNSEAPDSIFGGIPSLAELNCHDDPKKYPHTQRFKGGETAALARLKYYFWETNLVARYKETRNGLLGNDYSTKFSVYLWNGCISPRRIYHEIKKYESQRTANESTYWVIFELLWRDYFKFTALKYGDRIFFLHGLNKHYQKQEWKKDDAKFQAWCEGKTGYPFVDANMRELNATGFMSNRGRQNVASFLAKDLGIDWRLGAEYFEAMLIDHDPASNWGNWQYQAGVGLDPQSARYFNIMKQANDYDPKAEYTLHWVPELASLPGQGFKPNDIQQPWNLHLGSKLHYPNRIVSVSYSFPANRTYKDPHTKDISSFFPAGGRRR